MLLSVGFLLSDRAVTHGGDAVAVSRKYLQGTDEQELQSHSMYILCAFDSGCGAVRCGGKTPMC